MKRDYTLITAALALGTAAAAAAQMHVVRKPETVVRAVGVYEWTGDESKPTASRFVPVSLFIDAQLEDAGVYLARPVPFALSTGTLFELDHAGVPEGTLDIAFARHLQPAANVQVDDTWLGYGVFKPLPAPKLAEVRKRQSTAQVVVSGGKPPASAANTGTGPTFSKSTANDDDSDKPTLHRKDDSGSTPAQTTASSQTASTARPAASSDDDDSDRPTLIRKPGSDSTGTTSSGSTTNSQTASTTAPDTTVNPDDKADRPTLRKRSEADRQASRKAGNTASVSAGGSLNDDPDRPTIHRGGEGVFNPDSLKPLEGTPADMKQSAAVSDAASRPVHDFSRAWADDAERLDTLGRMQAFARARLAGYDTQTGKQAARNAAPAPGQPATAAARPRARKPAAPPAPLALTGEQIKGYTLSYGGDATYVYTASATGPDGQPQYVAVVAQKAPGSELKLAMASVTDAAHLDRTPWLRLVDAVDAEASNRASLLFELRATHTRQFALYRVIGAEAQQTFVSGTTD